MKKQKAPLIIGWGLAFFGCLLFPAQCFASSSSRTFILSVGVSHFDDTRWDPLKFAHRDALAIDDFFMNEADKKADWRELLVADPEKKSKVTHQQILEALARLKVDNQSEKELVIIYISTHGTIYQNQKTGELGRYLVTSNTNYDDVDSTSLSYKDLIAHFKDLKSRKKVLILDSCHSGTGKSKIPERIKLELKKQKGGYFPDEETTSAEGEILLFSAQYNEPSLEEPRLGHSVYTNFLIEGFRKDLNGDGAITITEAHLYARGLTQQYTNFKQNPTARILIDGVDPVIIHGEIKNKDKAYVYNRWVNRSHLVVLVDGITQGGVGKGFLVPAGKRRITLLDGSNKAPVSDKVVRFKEGREYTLESIIDLPSYPHTFDFSFGQFLFTDPFIRNNYAREDGVLYGLTYTHQEFWKIFDMGFSLHFSPELEEHFFLTTPYSPEKNRLVQKRKMILTHFFLGGREALDLLSTEEERIKSGVYWEFGPTLISLGLERSYYSPTPSPEETPIEYRPAEWRTYLGMAASLGFYSEIPSVNLRGGLEVSLLAMENPFDQGHRVTFGLIPQIFVGLHW